MDEAIHAATHASTRHHQAESLRVGLCSERVHAFAHVVYRIIAHGTFASCVIAGGAIAWGGSADVSRFSGGRAQLSAIIRRVCGNSRFLPSRNAPRHSANAATACAMDNTAHAAHSGAPSASAPYANARFMNNHAPNSTPPASTAMTTIDTLLSTASRPSAIASESVERRSAVSASFSSRQSAAGPASMFSCIARLAPPQQCCREDPRCEREPCRSYRFLANERRDPVDRRIDLLLALGLLHF